MLAAPMRRYLYGAVYSTVLGYRPYLFPYFLVFCAFCNGIHCLISKIKTCSAFSNTTQHLSSRQHYSDEIRHAVVQYLSFWNLQVLNGTMVFIHVVVELNTQWNWSTLLVTYTSKSYILAYSNQCCLATHVPAYNLTKAVLAYVHSLMQALEQLYYNYT